MYYQDAIDEASALPESKWTGDGRHDSMGHSAAYGTYFIGGKPLIVIKRKVWTIILKLINQ